MHSSVNVMDAWWLFPPKDPPPRPPPEIRLTWSMVNWDGTEEVRLSLVTLNSPLSDRSSCAGPQLLPCFFKRECTSLSEQAELRLSFTSTSWFTPNISEECRWSSSLFKTCFFVYVASYLSHFLNFSLLFDVLNAILMMNCICSLAGSDILHTGILFPYLYVSYFHGSFSGMGLM